MDNEHAKTFFFIIHRRRAAVALAALGVAICTFLNSFRVAGLEIDLAHFQKIKNKAYIFGILTTTLPLLLGTAVVV